MDLKQLQYFVASVDAGSFKKASETLYTSQPHISKTVKSLEEELQTELLQRRSRGVKPTKAGKKAYEYACRILAEAGRLQNVREGDEVHKLCVAANTSERLEELFRRFYIEKLDAAVSARYTECGTEEIFRLVHRHEADLGFVYVDKKEMPAFLQMLEYRYLEFIELGNTEPLLFVGPKNSLYTSSFVTMKELRTLNYVQMQDEQNILSSRLLQGTQDYQYHKRRRQALLTSSRRLMIQTVMETELGSISYGLCSGSAESEKLHGILIHGTEGSIVFGCIQRKRDGVSLEAKRFVEYVKKHMDAE